MNCKARLDQPFPSKEKANCKLF